MLESASPGGGCLPGGVFLVPGVSAWSGGVSAWSQGGCLFQGGSAWSGGVCLVWGGLPGLGGLPGPRGVCLVSGGLPGPGGLPGWGRGSCSGGVGIPACTEADTLPPLWTSNPHRLMFYRVPYRHVEVITSKINR